MKKILTILLLLTLSLFGCTNNNSKPNKEQSIDPDPLQKELTYNTKVIEENITQKIKDLDQLKQPNIYLKVVESNAQEISMITETINEGINHTLGIYSYQLDSGNVISYPLQPVPQKIDDMVIQSSHYAYYKFNEQCTNVTIYYDGKEVYNVDASAYSAPKFYKNNDEIICFVSENDSNIKKIDLLIMKDGKTTSKKIAEYDGNKKINIGLPLISNNEMMPFIIYGEETKLFYLEDDEIKEIPFDQSIEIKNFLVLGDNIILGKDIYNFKNKEWKVSKSFNKELAECCIINDHMSVVKDFSQDVYLLYSEDSEYQFKKLDLSFNLEFNFIEHNEESFYILYRVNNQYPNLDYHYELMEVTIQ